MVNWENPGLEQRDLESAIQEGCQTSSCSDRLNCMECLAMSELKYWRLTRHGHLSSIVDEERRFIEGRKDELVVVVETES